MWLIGILSSKRKVRYSESPGAGVCKKILQAPSRCLENRAGERQVGIFLLYFGITSVWCAVR